MIFERAIGCMFGEKRSKIPEMLIIYVYAIIFDLIEKKDYIKVN